MTSLLFVLVASALPNISAGPDLADRAQPVEAPIDAVTVFSDRARIHRRATTPLKAGVHTLALPIIPGAVLPGTLRVQIDSGRVLRVELRPIEQAGVSLPEVEKRLARLQELADEQAAIDARARVYNSELQFLQNTWVALPVAETERYGKVRPPLKPQVWKKGLDYIDARRRRLHSKVQAELQRRRALVKEIQLVQTEIGRLDLRASTRRQNQVFAIVRAPGGPVTIDVMYDLPGARWWPIYELHFSPAQRSVQLHYAGLVQQNTGEDWTRTRLSLSTAIPGQSIDLPELLTWTLGERREMIPQPRAERRSPQPPRLPAPSPRPSLASVERDIERQILLSRLSELQTLRNSNPLSLGAKLDVEEVEAFAVDEIRVDGSMGVGGLALSGRGSGGGGIAGGGGYGKAASPRPRMSMRSESRAAPSATYASEEDRNNEVFAEVAAAMPTRGKMKRKSRAATRQLALLDPTLWRPPRFRDRSLPAVLAGGFDYVFDSPVVINVTASSTRVKVPLASTRFDVELRYETTPALKKVAYLTARVKNASRKPILGGKMSLFVDGDFAGEGQLDTTGPGGELVLPLGADEDIRITRHVAPKTREEGFFGKKEVTDYEVRMELANHKKCTIVIDVFDVLPKTNNEKIEISLVKTSPALAAQADAKGRLRWRLTLAAGQTQKITFTYRIQRPTDWQLVQR